MKNIYTYVLTCLLALSTASLSFAVEGGQGEKEQEALLAQNELDVIKKDNDEASVEPTWDNLTISQKMDKSSRESYTYPFFNAEVELVNGVRDAFTKRGIYDPTPAIALLSLPTWAPFAAAYFTILLPSVPLHLTEASLRFAVQEAICRCSKLQKKLRAV
ncbi:MAG TPA: hypothetical protein VGT41_05750 [Candidatus Babeliales bacterium]|nr:hypothetical protein [Candidatus Babeliales bacterium]